jgi:hypothetical protein
MPYHRDFHTVPRTFLFLQVIATFDPRVRRFEILGKPRSSLLHLLGRSGGPGDDGIAVSQLASSIAR